MITGRNYFRPVKIGGEDMFREISKKYMKRSRVKTLVLMILICLITVFMILGVGMLVNSNQLLKQADETYTTVGILEYTAGEYPYERGMKEESLKAIEKFPLKEIQNQKEVVAFRDSNLLMGYVDGVALSTFFDVAFYHYSVIEFQVLYGTEDGGFRCTLTKSYYSNAAKEGKTFGLSFRDQEEKEKFKIEIGHKYLASGDFRNENNLLMFRPAGVSALVDNSKLGTDIAGYPVVDLTNSPDYMKQEANRKAWQDICDFYKVQNGSFQIQASDSLKTNRDFYLGNNYLKKGNIWSDQDAKDGEKVCVLHIGIATLLNKNIGDQIDLNLHFSNDSSNYYNSYDSSSGFLQKDSYRIVGIYDSIQDETDPYIYLPAKSVKVIPNSQHHFYMGSVVIKNGCAQEFSKKIEPLMKDYFRITIYDQGYEQTAAPIKAMKTNAILIITLCGGCCVAILMLFANLFVNKQQESIAVMTALGTTKKDIRFYIMHGATTILGTGALVGCAIGFFSAKGIISVAYQLSQKAYKQDLRFSSLRMGVQLPFEGKIQSSLWVALLIGFILVAVGIVICQFAANKLIRMTANFGGNISKKKKKKKKEKVVQAACASKEVFKYEKIKITKASFFPGKKIFYAMKQSMRSIKRNGKTSSVLLLVSLAITLFIVFYNQGITVFENKLEKTYETANVDGYYATITSQQMDARGVNDEIRETLKFSHNVKKVYPSSTCKYEYVDKLAITGTKEEQQKELNRVLDVYAKLMEKPKGTFGMEARISKIRQAQELIATKNLERSKEFFQNTKPAVEYLDGYENFFEKKSLPQMKIDQKKEVLSEIKEKTIPVLLNQKFARSHDIKLNDVIMISKVVLINEGRDYVSNEQLCHVVGTYKSKTNGAGIYTLYKNGGLSISAQNPYEFDRFMEFSLGDSYINYSLDHVKDFTKLRNQLEQMGVSPVGVMGDTRTCFVIDDKKMVQAVDNIQNNISFMIMLRYALFLLVVFIGFISAFMTMRTRKTDIAIIRSLGTGKIRTFFMFFLEYAAIGLGGVLLALFILYLNMGPKIVGQFIYILIFYFSFLIGSGVCVARMNRKNVLSILSNAE